MAGMTTVLVEFSNNGNSKTSTTSTHTAAKPRLVIEKRKVPEGRTTVSESSVKVVHATVDAEGLPIQDRVAFEAVVRIPVAGASADVTAALAIFRDIVAGDEFGTMVTTQKWL